MRAKILFIIFITAFIISGCNQIAIESGPSEQTDEVETEVDAPIEKQPDKLTPPSFENITTELPEEERGFAPFAIENIVSHGSLFSGSYSSRFKHDYVIIDILAREGFTLDELQFYSVAKGVIYNGSYDSEVECKVRDMASARKFNKYTVIEHTDTMQEVAAGSRFQACVPTPITMIRGEEFFLEIHVGDVHAYTLQLQYPSNLQDVILEFDESTATIVDIVANTTTTMTN